MQLLLKTEGTGLPFPASEIAEVLGYDNIGHIEAVIVSEACMSAAPVVPSTWAVPAAGDFATRCLHGGVPPVEIGPVYQQVLNPDRPDFTAPYRVCRYEPDPSAVALVRNRVLHRLANQIDNTPATRH